MTLPSIGTFVVNGRAMRAADLAARIHAQAQKFADIPLIANKKASIKLYQWVMMNFELEGALTAEGWPDLSDRTIEWKEDHGYEKPMQNTRNLIQSFLPYSDALVALVGSPVDYAKKHQMGDDGPPRLPQRRLLPNEDETQEIVMPIYDRQVNIVISEKW